MHAEVNAATGPYHSRVKLHRLLMGLHCTLRCQCCSRTPRTPNSKRPTRDGAPLRAEVSAATGPLSLSLSLSLSLAVSFQTGGGTDLHFLRPWKPAKRPFRPIRPVVSLLLLILRYLRVFLLPTDIAGTKSQQLKNQTQQHKRPMQQLEKDDTAADKNDTRSEMNTKCVTVGWKFQTVG